MDEDLASWDPYWRAINDRFEEFLSSVPRLRELRVVKFSVCNGNHRKKAWMNVITRLHSTVPSWYYMVDSIMLETQGKLGVVVLAMHDINKYILYASYFPTISALIEVPFIYVF
jgi:hypothetical protein